MRVSLNESIPNNINLGENRKLQKALMAWQPNFKEWWNEMGPSDFKEDQIYLRTAISVESGGWANFKYVKMPDYRFGIFLAPKLPDRTIACGDDSGKKSWDLVPGEWRKELRRIIVTQADTEPASVEQQRMLGHTAPSLYDMRNLFQVNVEEGRHLWAMVYLLHKHFGRDGREEADELLQRRSGNVDSPRILETFNKPMQDWVDFFCFTMFTDRDGKYQLGALAESAFEPLARSTRFMLTEEAHHLFVGETGVDRIIRRTCELMREAPDGDVAKLGGIPLDLMQRYINEWASSSFDLFGGEDSSNAATFFSRSLKGRWNEQRDKKITDHVGLENHYDLAVLEQGRMTNREVPLRRAMNALLLDNYHQDVVRGSKNWNKSLEEAGISQRMTIPSLRFNRSQGVYANQFFNPAGEPITEAEFEANRDNWFPSAADRAYVKSIMTPVLEAGKVANWIAPPKRGINGNNLDFEYVRFDSDPYVRA